MPCALRLDITLPLNIDLIRFRFMLLAVPVIKGLKMIKGAEMSIVPEF